MMLLMTTEMGRILMDRMGYGFPCCLTRKWALSMTDGSDDGY